MVSVVSCESYDPAVCRRALEDVLAPLGGLEFVTPGMTVGVKANLVSFLKPEAAATTHPALLSALTEMLLERGAKVIVGDSPGGLYTAAYVRNVYRAAGMYEVEKAGAMKDVLVKSTHGPAEAKALFKEYWKHVESGELLYMPVVQFCWKKHEHAAKILPEWIAEEPRKASMYEVCMDSDEGAAQLEKVRRAPGAPRIWINTMWDSLNNGRGDVKGFTDPDSTWGWSLGQGATMLQTDYGAEMLVYLNRIGRHSL